MRNVNCRMCGQGLDRGACNQTYAVVTVVHDSDETGTTQERSYVCLSCVGRLETFLLENEAH